MHPKVPELTSKRDILFRNAYERPSGLGMPLSVIDTILGNIGEPLRVDGEDDEVVIESDIDVEEIADAESPHVYSGGYHAGA